MTEVERILEKLGKGNPFGERVTLVAATKTRTSEEIRRAVEAGVTDIGENKVQEFCEKYGLVSGARWHFIGHLQRNKVKYLIGKTFLIHSVDSDVLAEEIARRSKRAGIVTDVLLEVNIGAEESKSGYPRSDAMDAFLRLSAAEGLRIRGFMAMLPDTKDEKTLIPLCDEMRRLYERAKALSPLVEYLSMGMSGDYELCISRGANMVRLGTAIFGERPLPHKS